jgi:hypothetical protein
MYICILDIHTTLDGLVLSYTPSTYTSSGYIHSNLDIHMAGLCQANILIEKKKYKFTTYQSMIIFVLIKHRITGQSSVTRHN